MKKTLFVFAAVAFLVTALPAFAQSPLADAARREAARRKGVQAPSIPVYTNEDLARLPPRAVVGPPRLPSTTEVTTIGAVGTPATPPIAAATGQPAAGAAAAPAPRDEKYWRERIGAVRTNISRAEIFAESLESRINALSADFVNRDDPAQRQKIFEQRERALQELNRVKEEIVSLQKQIAEIEDEARRLNVPAGWLR